MKASRAIIGILAILLAAAPARAELELEPVRALAAQGKTEQALARLDRMLAGAPEDSGGLFLRGVLLVELRRTAEAERIFKRLVETRPDLPEPYNNLAVIQAASGDYDGAVETLKRALQTNSSYRTAYDNLTKIYGQLASQAYRQALSEDPVEPAEVVQLVLLGSLSAPPVASARRAATGPPAAPTEPAPAPAPVAPDRPAAPAATAARPAPGAAAAPPAGRETGARPAPAPAREEVPAAAAAPQRGDVAATVRAWAGAWSEQRVDDYLAAYARGFQPPDGLARSEWEAQRRERLTRPSFIKVTIAFLDSKQVGEDRTEVRFIQEYESNTFADKVTKTLVLVWEDGGWKILEERVET